MANVQSKRERLQNELTRRDLPTYTKKFWKSVDKHDFASNWHIDCISDHLVAVKKRQITRLVINIPPRHMKSLQCCVFFPTWVWLTEPSTQFLCASYAQTLSTRDCVKSRRIITTPEYQALIPIDENGQKAWGLRKDQNQKQRYENTETGHRIATSTGGALTGDGGDIIIIDDPHNVVDAESATIRQGVLDWWDEAMSSRLNNINTGVYIVIQQRVHEGDLAGHILEKMELDKSLGWEHLCLPARYEMENRIKTSLTGWIDPRTKDGEPMWESHIDDKALRHVESGMTQYVIAGQLQQRPAPREGGMFKKADWRIVPRFNRDEIIKTVRYWDKAGSEDSGDWSAGVLMHKMRDLSYVVEKMERGQWSSNKREKIIKKNCKSDNAICDKRKFRTWMEQEPGSAGKESAENTIKNLAPHKVKAETSTGDKETRADGLASQVEIRNVYLVEGDWNKEFIEEFGKFPKGKNDDQVDCCSGAFHKLASKGKRAGGMNSAKDKARSRRSRMRRSGRPRRI